MTEKLIHVHTPDQQLDALLNTPGMTPAEVKFAEDWAFQENKRRRAFGLDWAKQRKDESQSRAKQLSEAIFEDSQLANDLCDRARRGDFESVAELFAIGAQIRKRMAGYERVITSIDTTDETIAALEADPASWFHEFYSKYPTIAAQVPTLAVALADWHQGRRWLEPLRDAQRLGDLTPPGLIVGAVNDPSGGIETRRLPFSKSRAP